MSKTLKIVLMVLASLVIVAALIGVGVMVSRHAGFVSITRQGLPERFEGRVFRMPMMGGGFGNRLPFGGFAFGGIFMFCLMFFRWLIPLALIGLVIYVAYRWGRGKGSQKSAAGQSTGGSTPVTPATVKNCRKCGNIVQEDWSHCPNCGTKQ